jgi:hypothetical protein
MSKNPFQLQKNFDVTNNMFRVKNDYEEPEKMQKFKLISLIFNVLSVIMIGSLCITFKLSTSSMVLFGAIWLVFCFILEYFKRHFGVAYKSFELSCNDTRLTKEEQAKAYQISQEAKPKFYAIIVLSVALAAFAGYRESYLFITEGAVVQTWTKATYTDSAATTLPYDPRFEKAVDIAQKNHSMAIKSDKNDVSSHRRAYSQYESALQAFTDHKREIDTKNEGAKKGVEVYNATQRKQIDDYNAFNIRKTDVANVEAQAASKQEGLIWGAVFCLLSVIIELFSALCLFEYLEVSFKILQSYKSTATIESRKSTKDNIQLENKSTQNPTLSIVKEEDLDDIPEDEEKNLLAQLAEIERRKNAKRNGTGGN